MKEEGKFSDKFNALNGDVAKRNEVLSRSNKLKQMGITDPNQIDRIYKSGDFLAFHDPLKIKNLEMFGIDNSVIDQIIVAEVKDKTRGHAVYQFINIGNDENMKQGDILTLDPDKEGKEAGTEFDEDFIEYCINIVRKEIPGIDRLQVKDISDEDIMETLGIKTYEDVIYMSAKSGGLKKQIESKMKTGKDKASFVNKLTTEKDEVDKIVEQDGQENNDEEKEGMTIEEASEVLGIEKEKLREVVGDNGKILGVKKTTDISTLAGQLDFEMSNAGSELVMLKIAGPGIKSEGLVLNTDGSPVFSKENGDTTLITELVEDGANGDNIKNINQAIREHDAESKKIETINPLTNEREVEFAQEGNEKSIAGYESDSNQLLKEIKEKIKKIEDGPGDRSDKLTMISDVLYNARGKLVDLQKAYNITAEGKLDEIEEQAEDKAESAELAKFGEVTEKAVKGVATGLFGGKVLGETNHDNGRMPSWLEDD